MKKSILLILSIIVVFLFVACDANWNTDSNDSNLSSNHGETITDDASNSTDVQLSPNFFIEKYNSSAKEKISDVSEIVISDKSSEHYRTEFRLKAFSNAQAKTGKIGNAIIDVITYGENNKDIRIYVDGVDLEQAKEIIKTASPVLDNNLSDSEIQKTLDYLDENKEANGYYVGTLGIVYSTISKDLMIKAE